MREEEVSESMEREEEYAKRLDYSMKLLQGSLDILLYNAKQTLEKRGKASFSGELRVEIDLTNLAYFDEVNKNAWSSDIKQMMSIEVSEEFLKQYRADNMPVDTLIVKIGDEIIARSMIPSGGRPVK